jgi:hypothetical protein
MYRGRLGFFLAIAAVAIPVDIATAVVGEWAADPADGERQVLFLLMTVVQLAFTLLVSAAIVTAAAAQTLGRDATFADAYAHALDRFSTLWWASLRVLFHVLLFAITIVGIPWAVQRFVRWLFVEQTVVLEGVNTKDALARSANVVIGQWWQALGLAFVVWLLVVIPNIVGTAAIWGVPVAVGGPIGAIVTAVTTPFLAIGMTLLYFDLKARKEREITADPGIVSA